MLSSSTRRVAFSVQPSQIIGCVNSAAYRTVATQTLSYRRSHQRRSSSSKSSSPANGPKGISEGQAVPAGPAQTRQGDDKKPAPRTSRRKAKDVAANCTVKARDEAMQNLPSVPSTHHVKSKGMNWLIESKFFVVLTPPTRNRGFCLLFPLSSHISNIQLPKSRIRKSLCSDLHPPNESKRKTIRRNINPLKHSQQSRISSATRTLERRNRRIKSSHHS